MLKIKCFFLILLVVFCHDLFSQTTIIDEDFTSGSLPAGWSQEVNPGGNPGEIWQFNDPGGRNISAGNFVGNYAILDSDAYGSGMSQNASLLTSTFSADLYDTLTLEFDYQYREYAAVATVVESCVVEVFNGTTWVEVFRKEVGDENYTGSTLESIDIKSAAGIATNAQVKFTYVGAFDWWWAIDNVKVSGDLIVPTNTSHLGPGGVGGVDGTSDLVLWTIPDDITEADNALFSSWSDLSGYSSDLTQATSSLQPIIKKNILNGYDAVRFEAANRRLQKTSFTNFPTTAISGFYINKTSDNTDGVLSYASTASNNNFLIFRSGNLTMYRNSPRTSGLVANNNVWNMVGYRWRSAGGNITMSLNGNNAYSSTNQNGNLITAGGDLALAGEQDGSSSPYSFDTAQAHQGDFTEVIIYKSYINEAERIIVSNYLSAKYNIAISANDFYDEDTSGENFDFDVAGIGQASDGSNHTDSQGTGIVRIYNPSGLANDEFLFWGRDNKDEITFETNTSNYQQRLSTNWRVSKRNDVGNVSFILDLNGIDITGKQSCSKLKLIVDNNSDLLSPTSTYEFTDIGSNLYKVNNVVFANNDYFTVEYQDLIVVDGTQFYNGSGASNVPNTTDNCYKLLVKNTSDGSLTLTENAFVREIEIESGGILSADSGILLQVQNGIENEGELRLVGSSQLVQEHTTAANLNSGNGNLHVDQTATTSSVYQSGYWSSPVSATIGAPFSIDDVLKDGNVPTAATPTAGEAGNINFNGAHDGNAASPIQISTRWLATFNNAADWTRFVSPTANVLTPGLGWNMKSVGSKFTFKGKPNDGDYSYSITKDNFSLIGNPYPSALDAQAFIDDNSSQFNGILYIYDSSSDNTHVRAAYTGTYTTIVSGVSVGGGRYLPIGQAFFITREAAGTGSLTFKNSQRTLVNLGDTGGLVARNSIESEQTESKGISFLKIGFNFDLSSTEKRTRQVAIAFRGLTDNYESGFDAEMWSLQPTDVYLTVKDRDNPFIITGVESFKSSLAVPLVVQLDQQRDVTFSLDEINNINASVYLLDNDLQKLYSLDNGPQVLNLPEGKYTDRFSIVFSKKILSNVDSEVNENLITIFESTKGQLTIKNTSNLNIETIKLYNLLGVEVESYDIKTNVEELNLDISKISKALYIVTLKTDKGIINTKIILK